MHNKAKPGTQAKFHLRTLVIATIVILAIVLALAPSSIYEEAKAQGVGSRNKSVQGTGLLGTINCPAGTPGAISGPQPIVKNNKHTDNMTMSAVIPSFIPNVTYSVCRYLSNYC
jgi:hypothetical protein